MFPVIVAYKGTTYVLTGKSGTDRVTGELASEYESVDDDGSRLWLYLSGRIVED